MPATLPAFLLSNVLNGQRKIVFINGSNAEEELTYAGLLEQALLVLYHLQQAGLEAGSELILQTDDNRTFLICFWACLLGRIIPVPVSVAGQHEHRQKVFRIWHILRDPWLLASPAHLQQLTEYNDGEDMAAMRQKCLDPLQLMTGHKKGKILPAAPGDIAYVQFSSGSTGDPKGVILTHANLVTNAMDIAARSEISPADRMLSWMPLTHDMGLICFHLTGVTANINQYILPTQLFIRYPVLWMEKANEHRATLLYSPNFGYQYFLAAFKQRAAPAWDLSAVRLIYNGAEPIAAALCREFTATLAKYGLPEHSMFAGYGLAEASVAVTLPQPGAPLSWLNVSRPSLRTGNRVTLSPSREGIDLVLLGSVMDNCRIRICDDEDRVLSEGYLGHVQICGGNVTAGYYNNPKATHVAVTADGWLRTGDMGFLHDRKLVLAGRHKHIIILNGQNYYPHDFEFIVHKHTGTALGKIAACGIADPAGGQEKLVVFVLSKDDLEKFAATAALVKTILFEQLGITTHTVLPVKRIYKTTSGKIQYYKLAELYRQGAFAETERQLSALADNNHEKNTVRQLTHILKQLLPDEIIAEDTHLISAGVSSLYAIRFIQQVNDLFHTTIGLYEFFSYPTIAQLSAAINHDIFRKEESSLPPVQVAQWPLSPVQQRFWALHQLNPASSKLHITIAFKISGSLNRMALSAAVTDIVAASPALRTVVRNAAAGPVLSLHGEMPRELLEDIPDVMAITEKPFLLDGELLCRWGLTADATLVIVLHHIIADGWSLSVLLQMLSTAYNKRLKSEPVAFPPQELYVKTTHLPVEKEAGIYWEQQLDQLPAPLTLFNTAPADPVSQIQGNIQIHAFAPGTKAALSTLGQQHDATLFMTILSLVYMLLAKLTDRKDLVIGTDSSGRSLQGLQDIGCFIQTLPLRVQMEGTDDFLLVLQKVKTCLLEALHHGEYSFEQMLENLRATQPGYLLGVFNILVIQQDADFTLQLDGADVHEFPLSTDNLLTDLQLEFFVQKELCLKLSYNTAMYTGTDISRLCACLEVLMACILETPLQQLNQLEIIPLYEKEQVIRVFNHTAAVYPADRSYPALFRRRAKQFPEHTAIDDGSRLVSYALLDSISDGFAGWLQRQHRVGTGTTVAVKMERSASAIITILAILKTGAAYLPVDKAFPDARVLFMLQNSHVSLLLTDEQPDMEALPVTICIVPSDPDAIPVVQNAPVVNISPSDRAYTIYTSGTTGMPKAITISHASLLDYTHTFSNYFCLSADDRMIQQAPLSFDTAVEEIFPVLSVGGILVIHAAGGADIDGLIQTINRSGATILSTVPAVLAELNKRSYTTFSLRSVIAGGERLLKDDISRLLPHTDVYNTYGPAEATVCSTYYKVKPADTVIPLGKPIANRQIYILDEAGNPVPIGVTGEICIAGAGLAIDYQEKLMENPFTPGTLLFRTGDLGRWRADGNIEFSARKDDQIKIAGKRIEPGEIAHVLLQQEGIREVLVLPVQHSLLAAYYRSDEEIDGQQLRAWLRRFLPEYMIPAYFIFLKAFPYTLHGKIDRKALPLPVRPDNREQEVVVADAVEVRMLELWQAVLQVAHLRVTDRFFEAGGNSIKAFRLSVLIFNAFRVQVDIRLLFSNPDVITVARAVKELPEQEQQKILPAAERPYYAASHAQQRLWLLGQMDHHTTGNLLSWAYNIEGALDVAALQFACRTIVERHESLRTHFRLMNGELMQVISAPPVQVLSFIDLKEDTRYPDESVTQYAGMKDSGHVDVPMTDRAASIVASVMSKPMDLYASPLYRFVLLQVTGQRYILAVSIHHIIADGWSVNILLKELLHLYECAIKDTPHTLPAPGLQFRDYAAWEASFAGKQLQQEQLTFWQQELLGKPVPATTETGLSRGPVKRSGNGTYRQLLHAVPAETIDAYCQERKVSHTIMLMTALNMLLYRQQGTRDIITGMMMTGRRLPELEGMVGFFVNTLPLRIVIPGDITPAALMEMVREKQLTLFDRQDYPYEVICRELNSGKPLFNIVVASVIKTDADLNSLPGLKVTDYCERSPWRNDFDLTMALESVSGQLELQLLYNGDLYKNARIVQICGDLMACILFLVHCPELPLSGLELPSEKVRSYWKEYFAFYTGDLIFPAGKPATDGKVERVHMEMEAETHRHIRAYAQTAGVSAAAFFSVITGMVLGRYNLKDEVVIGLLTADAPVPLRMKGFRTGSPAEMMRGAEAAIAVNSAYPCDHTILSALMPAPAGPVFRYLLVMKEEIAEELLYRYDVHIIFLISKNSIEIYWIKGMLDSQSAFDCAASIKEGINTVLDANVFDNGSGTEKMIDSLEKSLDLILRNTKL